MDVRFCREAVEEAVACYGTPDILKTDQGSQFTSHFHTECIQTQGIRLSMDGQDAWRNNIFVERLWRSVKYEEISLQAYDSVSAARTGLVCYFQFYSSRRPHLHLGGQTPDQVYFNNQLQHQAA